MREITIKFKGDEKEALASVARLSKAIAGLNNPRQISSGQKFLPGGFDVEAIKQAYSKVDALTKAQQRFALVGYRADVREFNRAEKEKQRAAEISAIAQIQKDKQVFIARENQRKRDYQEFVRLEKEKARAAQQAARQSSNSKSGQFAGDLFSAVFGASTLAGLTVNAVSSVLGGVQSGISAGFDQAVAAGITAAGYQQTKAAITGVLGSAVAADVAIAKLEKTAINTPGLTFRNALEGYQRLRAVQFGASEAERALIGLSKVKVLSGGTKEDLQAVLINFAQIRSVGKLTGDELRETLGRFPYFAQVLQRAFGTISTEKIGELQLSSEEFFNRIFDEMDKLPSVAGGAADSWEKLVDEFYKAQSAFGTPLLQPAIESMQDLTVFLRDNKDTWAEWGTFVGDIIRGMNSEIKTLNEQTSGGNSGAVWAAIKNGIRALPGSPLGGGGVAALGAEARRKFEQREKKAGEDDLSLMANDVFDFSKQKDAQDKEVRLYKETIKEIASLQQVRLANSEIFYTRERALVADTVRYNSEQELTYQLKLNQIDRAEATKRLSIMEQSIERQKGLNEKLIKSYNPQDQGRIRGIKELEIAEKTADFQKEQAKYFLDEANRRREILDLEKRIADERRQAAIEAKKLQIEQSGFGFDNQIFDVQRLLSKQFVSAKDGYDKLIDLTQKSYQETSRLTLESYQLQLQDLSLTKEQRLNLTTEMFLSEQKLAEDNRRKILDLQDKQLEESRRRTEAYLQDLQAARELTSSIFSTIGESFFNPNSFTSATPDRLKGLLNQSERVNELNKLIAQSKEMETRAFEATTLAVNNGSPQNVLDVANNAWNDAVKNTGDYIKQLDGIKNSGRGAYIELENIARSIAGGNTRGFDEAAKAVLKYRQMLERASVDSQINFLSGEYEKNKTPENSYRLNEARRKGEKIAFDQAAESAEQYANSLDGLRDSLARYAAGDTIGLKFEAERRFLLERKSLVAENVALEQKFYEDSEYRAELRRNKLLQYERDIFEIREELNQKSVFNGIEAQAKIFAHLEQNTKSASDLFADSFISAFDLIAERSDSFLDKIGVGKIPILGDFAKAQSRNFLSSITTNLLDKFGFGDIVKTGNPVLDESKTQTKLLDKIEANTRTAATVTNTLNIAKSPDNGASAILNLLGVGGGTNSGGGYFGAGFGGGIGNPNIFSANPRGATTMKPDDVWAQIVNGTIKLPGNGRGGGGSFWDKILGAGGIFGEKGFGNNVGTYGALGGFANLAGGLIGGRVGGFISGIGSGAAMGASIGSIIPGIGTAIGAGIGAVGGFFASLFGGDPKRKEDKKKNLPALNQGFTDAFQQFQQLITDTKALRVDPDSSLAKGTELRSQIASGFGIQFLSKKYQKESQKLIQAKLAEIDRVPGGLFDQLKKAVEVAKTAGDRQNRLLPEFASGAYIDPKIYNGMISGRFDGRDTLLARLSHGEMVLNPSQIRAVINRANTDVFAGIVPNYKTVVPTPQTNFAAGGMAFAAPVAAPSPVIVIEKLTLEVGALVGTEAASQIVVTGVKTSDGHTAVVKSVEIMRTKKEGGFV